METFYLVDLRTMYEYTIFITAIEDDGTLGLGSVTQKFYGPRRPKPPLYFKAQYDTSKGVILCSWEDSGVPGFTYNLYYTIAETIPSRNELWSKMDELVKPEVIIGGENMILFDTKYTFKVTTVSKFGLESRPSNIVEVVTRDPLPSAPTNLTVYNIPDTVDNVKIMWDEPDDMSIIKNFEISVECEKCIQKKQTYIAKGFEYTVPNLEPGVFYKVKVVGVSLRTDRYGLPSISQRFQIPDRRPLPAAGDIRAKSTLSEITVSWKWDGDRTKLAHFRLVLDYASQLQNGPDITVEVPYTQRTHVFENLEKGTEYVINTFAVAKNGVEAASEPHHISTKSVYNSTVASVEIMPGPGSATVKWTRPKDIENRDIQVYQLRYKRKDDEDFMTRTIEKNRKSFGLRNRIKLNYLDLTVKYILNRTQS